MSRTFSLNLTPDELLHLDGKCSSQTQEKVAQVKYAARIAERYGIDMDAAIFVTDVVVHAVKEGKLTFSRVNMLHCPVTDQKAGWVQPKRKTRDNPWKSQVQVPFVGYDLGRGFVVMQNYPRLGISAQGLEIVKPALSQELRTVVAEVPEEITGYPPLYRKEPVVQHKECGWEGRKSLTESSDPSWYGTVCPCCQKHDSTHGFMFSHTSKDEVVSIETLEMEKANRGALKQALQQERDEERRKQREEQLREYRERLAKIDDITSDEEDADDQYCTGVPKF